MTPIACDFCYLSHLLTNFSRINQSRGLLLLFSYRDTAEKFWKWKSFPLLEISEIHMGRQFWVEKNDSRHKNPIFLVIPIFQEWISESDDSFPSWEGFPANFCLWRHISKNRKATRLKFCIRHSLMLIMTHAKFHFNRVTVTINFGIRACEHSLPGPDERLKRPGHMGSKGKSWMWGEI